jgi:uncharacterized delta-60 repeat protein
MRKPTALLWIALILSALMATAGIATAQEANWWVKTFQGDITDGVEAVAVAPNGDVVVAGTTNNAAWVLRLDEKGNVKWGKTYGMGVLSKAASVAVADNGDVIVAGWTQGLSAGEVDFWVLRLDENGKVKWEKTYGGDDEDYAHAVAIAKNGDIIVVGDTKSFGPSFTSVWVLRLDGGGNIKWQKTYGSDGDETAYAVAITKNGDIIVAGDTNSFGAGGSDFWVLRLDENGNVRWQRTYGGDGEDHARAVAIAKNGDIIVAGTTESFGAGGYDAWVLRLDEKGNVKWEKTYGNMADDYANAVAVAPNGNIVVGGNHLFALDPNGNLKWSKGIGATDIKLLGDGTMAFAYYDATMTLGHIGRINVNRVNQYSGWNWDQDFSLEVQDTNAQVIETGAQVDDSDAQIQDTNAEIHDTSVQFEMVWSYAPSTSQSQGSTTHTTSSNTHTTNSAISSTTTQSPTPSSTPSGGEGKNGGGICGPALIVVLSLLPRFRSRRK